MSNKKDSYIFDPQLWGKDSSLPTQDELGGKAFNLWLMSKAGFNVPRFLVITSCFFEDEFTQNELSEIIETALSGGGLPANGCYFAVRSSAVGEDGADDSYAGQLDTLLFVPRHELPGAVMRVHESLFGERVAVYRREKKIKESTAKAAVVIQLMIDSVVSGVAFAVAMDSGSRRGETVSSVFGLGEGLVGGLVEGDTFYVTDNEIKKVVGHKQNMVAMKGDGGTEIIELPPEKQNELSLTDEQVRLVAATVRKASDYYGQVQDMEFAFDADGVLHLLQTRPVTTLNTLPDPDGGECLWDNSNIVESYPGVTLPLTFSFIREVYSEVYKQFCSIMGVETELIRANTDAFEMLGIFRGRVYYNLFNWYRVLMLLPGYEINAPFMEQMMGVKEPLGDKVEVVKSRRGKYRRLATLFGGFVRNFFTLERQIKRFRVNFESALSMVEEVDLNQLNVHELSALYGKLERRLLPAWQPPLINDFFAMIYYGAVKKMLLKWDIDPDGTLQNNLLAGEGGIISAEPVLRLRSLAGKIIAEQELRQRLESNDNESFFELLKLERYKIVATEYHDYIAKFGKRCIGELKLETITYEEDPTMLLDILRCYVKAGNSTVETDGEHEKRLRLEAEEILRKKLSSTPFKRVIFGHFLKNARKFVKNRENLRFERTRLFAAIRQIFIVLGRRLHSEGVLHDKRDIFYLTKSEIFDFINATGTPEPLSKIVENRKDIYDGYVNMPLPSERFRTFGMPYWGNDFCNEIKPDNIENISADEPLKGIGCCGGIARGRVKIVRDPTHTEDLTDCILAAERTDPGWAPLFPVCRAVLVERGSILSHAAIVTRELGIPSIVGIRGLTARLKDGEVIEIDGKTGVIRRIPEGENSES